MFTKLKKCLAAFVTAALTASCLAGCAIGESTSVAMTIGGYELPAGIYIYFQNQALEEAKSKAAEDDSKLDTNNEDALKAVKIEGKDFLDWVNDETMKSCTEYVAVEKEFESRKLKVDDKEKDALNKYIANMEYEEDDSNIFYLNGISEKSIKSIYMNSLKRSAVFDDIYGEGGEKGVTEDELKKFYIENNRRARIVSLDMHDSDGNVLDDAGKKEIEKMADDYLGKVKGKTGEELLTAFDDIQSEYDEYVQSKTADASDSSDDAAVTTAATTTAAETTETTVAETEAEDSDNDEAFVDDPNVVYAAETTPAADADSDSETTTTEVTTAAAEAETTAETTTTVSPYAQEQVIPKVTTTEGQKEEDVFYNPCKAVYDRLFDDSMKYEVPEIVKDEENNTIYVIVKLDIEKRMTADDLWGEDGINSARHSEYGNEFEDTVKKWADALEVKKNDDAVERYKPFGYKEPETTATTAQQPMGL